MSTGQIHPSSCIIRPLINLESNETYKDVTQHGAWIRSIGRISNAARIPLLSVALAFQIAVLLPIRFVVTLLAEGIGRAIHGTDWTENKHYKNLGIVGMNFKGLCNSVINIIKTIDRTASAAINVLYSPPKEHESFGLEMIDMLDFGGVLTGIDPEGRVKKFLSKEPAVLRSLKNSIGWEPEAVINARAKKNQATHKAIMDDREARINQAEADRQGMIKTSKTETPDQRKRILEREALSKEAMTKLQWIEQQGEMGIPALEQEAARLKLEQQEKRRLWMEEKKKQGLDTKSPQANSQQDETVQQQPQPLKGERPARDQAMHSTSQINPILEPQAESPQEPLFPSPEKLQQAVQQAKQSNQTIFTVDEINEYNRKESEKKLQEKLDSGREKLRKQSEILVNQPEQ